MNRIEEKMALENIALWTISAQIGLVLRRGCWPQLLRSVTDGGEVGDEINNCVQLTRPDAYAVDVRNNIIQVYEIEDHSKMSVSKLVSYYELSELLGEVGWALHVYTTDRYGRFIQQCDTFFAYYGDMGKFPLTDPNCDVLQEDKEHFSEVITSHGG